MSNLRIFLYLFFVLPVLLGSVSNINAADNLFEKGLSEFKAENYEEALEYFVTAYKGNPDNPQITYYLGLTNREVQNFPEAVRAFRETLKLDPKASEAKFLLADVLYNMGNYEEALNNVEAAITEGVKPSQSNYLKGLILLKLKRNAAAVEAFKKAKELDSSLSQQADFQIASIYVQDREFKKAEDMFKGLITVDPTSDWALFSKDYLEALGKIPPPYRLYIGLGLQYDDNVLAIPIDQSLVNIEKQADWKRIYSLFGEYTLYAKDRWNIKASYSLNVTQYNKSDYLKTASGEKIFSQDTVTHTLSLMPSYNTEKSVTSLLLTYSYLEVDYTEYMQTFTVNPLYTFIIKGNHLGQISLKYKRDKLNPEYFKTKYGNYLLREENRDADNFAAGVGYFYTFLKGNGLFNLKLESAINSAEGANWDYTSYRLSSGFLYPFIDNRLKANIFAEIYHQGFSHENTIYKKERRDDTVTLQTFLTYTIIKPLDISVGYAHIRDDSNISVYKYRKNLYTANLEYRF